MHIAEELGLVAVDDVGTLDQISRLARVFALEDMLSTFVEEGVPGVAHDDCPRGNHVTGLLQQYKLLIQPYIDDGSHVVV